MRLPVWLLAAALSPLLAGDAAFERIDAHVHTAPPPEAFLQMLDRLRVRVLNVTLVDPLAPGFDKPEPQTSLAGQISERSGGRIAWAAPLDPGRFAALGFVPAETERLARAFDRGAVAAKIYKSVGLHLKTPEGKYLMPDDGALAPVLDFLPDRNKPLLAHLGEPRSSWMPLDPADPHYGYYKANPAWHMYEHPEMPSWESIIAARDRMLAAHPRLKVIGCHLGSLEHDVDEVAKRLDKYPNFAVDTAARVPDLMRQPREKVRAFMLRYQDRVLWGTDSMELSWKDPAETVKRWEAVYERDWEYFAGAQGLALPAPALRKIFRENALRWIPGIALPRIDEVLDRYVQAMGGEAALRNVKTRAFAGSIFIATHGVYGEYQEIAAAPRKFVRRFRFPGYAMIERGFDGRRAWEESAEYGIEALSGDRLSEVRRQAAFHLALQWTDLYSRLSVKGREILDGQEAVAVLGAAPDGAEDTLWFDAAGGLLLGIESTETFANGVRQRVRYLFEDYRPVGGVQVAHRIRYESPRLIWVVNRQGRQNVPLDDAHFRPPDERLR